MINFQNTYLPQQPTQRVQQPMQFQQVIPPNAQIPSPLQAMQQNGANSNAPNYSVPAPNGQGQPLNIVPPGAQPDLQQRIINLLMQGGQNQQMQATPQPDLS